MRVTKKWQDLKGVTKMWHGLKGVTKKLDDSVPQIHSPLPHNKWPSPKYYLLQLHDKTQSCLYPYYVSQSDPLCNLTSVGSRINCFTINCEPNNILSIFRTVKNSPIKAQNILYHFIMIYVLFHVSPDLMRITLIYCAIIFNVSFITCTCFTDYRRMSLLKISTF